MSLISPTQIRVLDPDEIDTAGISWAGALAGTTDTVLSCSASIDAGTCLLAPTLTGTYGTTAACTVTGQVAEVAIKSPAAGTLKLRFRAITTQGRTLDETRTFSVQSR